MSDVDAMIADLTEKRDRLTKAIESLEWFKTEFPLSAAGTFAARVDGKAKRAQKRTDGRSKARASGAEDP